MNTDIQKMRAAYMVYKHMNYAAAAEYLNFTPSAISKQVMALEKDLGITLFVRHGKGGIEVTEEAQKIMPLIETCLRNFSQLERGIDELSQSENVFYFGVKSIFPTYVTANFIKGMLNRNPLLDIKTVNQNDYELVRLVGTGKIDAGIIALQGDANYKGQSLYSIFKENRIEYAQVLTEPEKFILNKNHPLASNEIINFDEIMDNPDNIFIFINPNPGEMQPRMKAFQDECRKRRITRKTMEISFEMGVSMDLMKNLIAGNKNIVASVPSATTLVPGIVGKTCINNAFSAKILAYYRKDDESANIKAFKEVIKDIRNNGIAFPPNQ